MKKRHIRLRTDKCDTRSQIDADFFQIVVCSGMCRKDKRQTFGNLSQCLADTDEDFSVVYIAWPVQCDDSVRLTAERVFESTGFESGGVGPCKLIDLIKQIIHHNVTDVMNGRCRVAFLQKVLLPARFGHKKPVSDTVGYQ